MKVNACNNCETTDGIIIQVLYNRGPFELFVVVCKYCDEFTPVKVGHGTQEERHDDCIKAWNKFNPKKTPYKLGDFDRWYQPCEKCGLDPGRHSNNPKKDKPFCWKCGNRIYRDYSERALNEKAKQKYNIK